MHGAARLILTTALVGALIAAPAEATPTKARVDATATKLLDQAHADTQLKDPTCFAPSPFLHKPAPVISGGPDPALVALLSPLRRPQTDEERALLPATERTIYLSPANSSGIFGGAVRIMQAADGTRYFLSIGKTDPAFRGRNLKTCIARRRGALRGLLRHSSRAVQRRARELDHESAVKLFEVPPNTMAFGTYGRGGANGSSSGPVRVADLARPGSFGSIGHGGDEAEAYGLLPDGVAGVTFTFRRAVSRGPGAPPKLYPSEVVLTAPVQQNVFSLHVPRRAEDAFPSRTEWRRADGSLMRCTLTPTGDLSDAKAC